MYLSTDMGTSTCMLKIRGRMHTYEENKQMWIKYLL